jgi:thymidylate kinase
MPITNYKAIVCEGGDQVGKADAILTFSEKMMDMGVPVTYASFPIYATPIGVTIRLFLRQGLDELKLPKIRELKVKMAMYALNRLEFMDVLLSHPFTKDTLLLLDRSPFSNAITIAYGLANMEEAKDLEVLEELLDYALQLEEFMIKKMSLTNCVVQMVSEDRSWNNVRNEKADINENEDVQMASDRIYGMYAKRMEKGWKQIITKKREGWRDRDEIFQEIYNFLIERVGEIKPMEKKMMKIRYEIGIEEILKGIYKGEVLPEGIVTKYLKALRTNDKDTMHDMACIIGVEVGKTCKVIKFKHKTVRNAAYKIIEETPEVLDVLSYFISKDFSDKFVKAINEH